MSTWCASPPDSEHEKTHEAPEPQGLGRALRLFFISHWSPETVEHLPKPFRAYKAPGYGGYGATSYWAIPCGLRKRGRTYFLPPNPAQLPPYIYALEPVDNSEEMDNKEKFLLLLSSGLPFSKSMF
ncbi:hypothetical protein HPB48_012198 [Haemaphysalis longicornis]|uniref:Uncharacterized protein n=1 Tax=Haemaphysalis longicornis TaxID=44386 RepID=A0A9J6GTU2_HAELO|nr:hypothetical protein HPB48_012198 [Haemaphysalis longicornis]